MNAFLFYRTVQLNFKIQQLTKGENGDLSATPFSKGGVV